MNARDFPGLHMGRAVLGVAVARPGVDRDGAVETLQTDTHWRDLILFYEYFNGDNGAGVGASHQTDWTGLVAKLPQ